MLWMAHSVLTQNDTGDCLQLKSKHWSRKNNVTWFIETGHITSQLLLLQYSHNKLLWKEKKYLTSDRNAFIVLFYSLTELSQFLLHLLNHYSIPEA